LFQLPDKSKPSTSAPASAAKPGSNTNQKKDTKKDDNPHVGGGVKIVPPTRSVTIAPANHVPVLRREVIIEPPTKKTITVDGDVDRVVVSLGKMTRSVILHDQTEEEITRLNKTRRGNLV